MVCDLLWRFPNEVVPLVILCVLVLWWWVGSEGGGLGEADGFVWVRLCAIEFEYDGT